MGAGPEHSARGTHHGNWSGRSYAAAVATAASVAAADAAVAFAALVVAVRLQGSFEHSKCHTWQLLRAPYATPFIVTDGNHSLPLGPGPGSVAMTVVIRDRWAKK